MTIWKPVLGYENLYQVSDDGRINTRDRRGEWVPKALNTDRGGYRRVTLSKGGKKRSRLVHHLVLEAFVGPRPEGYECRHLNGDPTDNRPKNLIWGTSSENKRDIVQHGHHHSAIKTHCKNGHEFTPENTMTHPRGGRQCRTCNNDRARKWYEANKGPRQVDNKNKTHCKRGHEFTPENTIRRKDGGRQCRACATAYFKDRYLAKKAAQPPKG